MKTITISSKYQVVIPRAVRAILGVGSGDRLVVERVSAQEVVLKKAPGFKDLIGTLPTQAQDPVKRVRHLRDDWK